MVFSNFVEAKLMLVLPLVAAAKFILPVNFLQLSHAHVVQEMELRGLFKKGLEEKRGTVQAELMRSIPGFWPEKKF